VRFDWRVVADRPLLRALSPLLRPALRWNHNWAIARARDGLEPYALATFADKRSSSRARTAGHFLADHAVVGGVAGPVRHVHVAAQDTLELCREGGEGRARARVACVGLELDALTAQVLETRARA
jgi:hypothetical protein